MPQRRTLHLTDEQRRTLVDYRDHDRRPYLRERCAALLKIADGYSPHWVSQQGLLKQRAPDTVYSRVVAVYGPSYFMTSLSHEENEC